jgi:hypothetical protein
LAPTNGSVTRADIEAIYAEARQLGPMTADEAIDVILGAIVDWHPSPRQSAEMSARARRREAAKRAERQARSEHAPVPVRAAAAA